MIENDAFKLLLINLFHLNPDDIANILCTTFNKMMVLVVTLTDKHQACPYCGFTAPKIKEYVTKEITHSAFTTQKCIIKYRARRYKCSCCGKTYYEFNPFVFKSQKISILTVHNILKDLKDFNETFTSVARRYHVSPTSVSTILIIMWILAETRFRKSLILMRCMPLNPKRVNMSVFFLILRNRFLLISCLTVKRNIF